MIRHDDVSTMLGLLEENLQGQKTTGNEIKFLVHF